MQLLNGPRKLNAGQYASFPLVFTPVNFLQGIACGGDDGFVTVGQLPDGLTFDAPTLTISGTPTRPGFYSLIVEVQADPDCGSLVAVYQATLDIEVLLWNQIEAPCGPNSPLITTLWLIRPEGLDRVLGRAQGIVPIGAEWPDMEDGLSQHGILVAMREGRWEESPKDEPSGPIYDVKIEAVLTKDRPDLERFRRAIQGRDWIAYTVDAGGVRRVHGSTTFALRAMVKFSKGKSNQATLSIQGMVPDGSVMLGG